MADGLIFIDEVLAETDNFEDVAAPLASDEETDSSASCSFVSAFSEEPEANSRHAPVSCNCAAGIFVSSNVTAAPEACNGSLHCKCEQNHTEISRRESYEKAVETTCVASMVKHRCINNKGAKPANVNYTQTNGDVHSISGSDERSVSNAAISTGAMSRKQKVKPMDVHLIKQLALTEGGLISDEFRRFCWPLLVGLKLDNKGDLVLQLPRHTQEEIERQRDYRQVELDVIRTLSRFPPNMNDVHRKGYQRQLSPMIVRVLMNHDGLFYYQGFHDVCLTFLLSVGEARAFAICDRLAATRFRVFLAESLTECERLLRLMYPLIRQVDPELENFLWCSEVGTLFGLSWLITWFGHVLGDYRKIVRLYDLFLASHDLMPIYLGAAILLYRSNEILSCDCDQATVHTLLSKIPVNLPLETIISNALDLYVKVLPSTLLSLPVQPPQSVLRDFGLRLGARNDDKRIQKRKRENALALSKKKSLGRQLTFIATVAVTAAAIYFYNHAERMGLPWTS